ncbi:hypothetical protein CJS41_24655, partial [Salmonella enterica subsp. enterica serovar Kentucky]
QKSTGAIYLEMGTERSMFQAGVLRNALRAPEAVRATDVMVNPADRQVQKKPRRAFLYLIELHTLQPSGLP